MACFFTLPAGAQDKVASGTLESLYPNLASGILMYAQVAPLPGNILLRAEGMEIAQKDIDQFVARQPKRLQPEMAKSGFFALEQVATERILLKLARDEAAKSSRDVSGMTDDQVRQTFFDGLTRDITVSEGDAEKFYKENETLFCGAPLAQIRQQVESQVSQDKKQRFQDDYYRNLGQKMGIVVADAWLKDQAQTARNNPLDQARAASKPTLAVFSAKSCCGPDKMGPIVGAIQKTFGDAINCVSIDPRREQVLSTRYGVRTIPTQILFDRNGRESFRNNGLITEKDLADKIGKLKAS
jgi:thioredoxin 1